MKWLSWPAFLPDRFLARMEQMFWYAFLIVLPWQTRMLFWQQGLRFSEWQSMALWLSDVVLIGLLFIVLLQDRAWLRRVDRIDIALGVFLGVVLLSVSQASIVFLSWYWVARLLLLALFFKYLRGRLFQKIAPDTSATVFVAGVLMQAVLAIVQYVIQHDVGLRWMGETLLATDMRGVAVFFNHAGEKVLRAYGAFPHPNILAAYLLVGIWVFGWLYLRHGNDRKGLPRLVWMGAGAILIAALYFTYARTVIVAGVIAAIVLLATLFSRRGRRWHKSANLRRQGIRMAIFAAIVCISLAVLTWPQTRARLQLSSSDEAVQLRVRYAQDALGTGGGFLALNWIGVGIGNLVPWMMKTQPQLPFHLYQPTHNIYLLAYAEIGILGLIALLAWLGSSLHQFWEVWSSDPFVRLGIAVLVGALLFVAFWDHFFWTLQQGRLLWWLVLAVAAGPYLTKRN